MPSLKYINVLHCDYSITLSFGMYWPTLPWSVGGVLVECWCQKLDIYQLVSAEVGCLLGDIGNGTFISWCQKWHLKQVGVIVSGDGSRTFECILSSYNICEISVLVFWMPISAIPLQGFTNYGYTLLALLCGVIIGCVIFVILLFILYKSGHYKVSGAGSSYEDVDQVRVKEIMCLLGAIHVLRSALFCNFDTHPLNVSLITLDCTPSYLFFLEILHFPHPHCIT